MCDRLKRIYPTIKDFMLANSPDRQTEVCANHYGCHFGESPTLSQLNACYGVTAAEAWLVPQLYELGNFEGLKGQADRHQLAKTAKIIATEFHYLKTDELLLFFYRFSTGRYGRFYSYFTPSVIIHGLRSFLDERAFYRFSTGRYGRFYSYFTPSVIIHGLRSFLDERATAFNKREQERRERAWEEARRNAVTYEEYLKNKGRSARPQPGDGGCPSDG